MRLKITIVFAVCMSAAVAVAQSLGDAARDVRAKEDASKPKASLTLTNDEVARRDMPAPVRGPGPSISLDQQTAKLNKQTKEKEFEIWRAKVDDARLRVARLEAEVRDLQARSYRLRYPRKGDPMMSPITRADAIKAIDKALEDEINQLTATRDELDDDRQQAKALGFVVK